MSDYDPCGCPSPGHPAHGHAFCVEHAIEDAERHVYGYGIVSPTEKTAGLCFDSEDDAKEYATTWALRKHRVVRLRWEEIE